MTDLTDAISIASDAHDGQVDKAGQPYILHPIRVMLAMRNDTDRIVAVLHDVVEDSFYELVHLERFGQEVIGAIDALTRRDGENYFHYIDRLSTNSVAVRVKLADLNDNLDVRRIENPSSADIDRARKYRKARSILQGLKYD